VRCVAALADLSSFVAGGQPEAKRWNCLLDQQKLIFGTVQQQFSTHLLTHKMLPAVTMIGNSISSGRAPPAQGGGNKIKSKPLLEDERKEPHTGG
jgi:hypothetical protein